MPLTCLHLEMLIHARTQSFQPYYLSSNGKKEYADFLCRSGLITIKVHPPHLKTAFLELTEKGEYYLEALLSVPFPEAKTSWTIPKWPWRPYEHG